METDLPGSSWRDYSLLLYRAGRIIEIMELASAGGGIFSSSKAAMFAASGEDRAGSGLTADDTLVIENYSGGGIDPGSYGLALVYDLSGNFSATMSVRTSGDYVQRVPSYSLQYEMPACARPSPNANVTAAVQRLQSEIAKTTNITENMRADVASWLGEAATWPCLGPDGSPQEAVGVSFDYYVKVHADGHETFLRNMDHVWFYMVNETVDGQASPSGWADVSSGSKCGLPTDACSRHGYRFGEEPGEVRHVDLAIVDIYGRLSLQTLDFIVGNDATTTWSTNVCA